jgi:integrase
VASIINRGSKSAPLFVGSYKDGAGKWRQTAIPEAHRATKKLAQKWIDGFQEDIDKGKPDPRHAPLCGPLLETWLDGLTNRDAENDRFRARKHIVPRFKALRVDRLTKREVVLWLRELRAAKVSGPSAKKLFTLLSRFCAWLSADDTIPSNPCRDVPANERPRDSGKRNRPWLSDEEKVRALRFALPPAYALMFAVGRTAGMRPSEVAGLRVSDIARLAAEGVLRVRYSYDTAMLKEDKGEGERKTKVAPIHDPTVAAALLALAERRQAAGAGPEDRLFDHLPGQPVAIRRAWARAWKRATKAVGGVDFGWYESTRHSFASTAIASGARDEEVSRALGHATMTTTRRYYDLHREVAFGSLPASDLGAPLPDAKILPFPAAASR